MADDTGQGPPQEAQDPAGTHGRKRRPPLTKAQRLVLQERALELKLGGTSYAKIAIMLSDPKVVTAMRLPPGFVVTKVAAWRLVDDAIRPVERAVDASSERLRDFQVRQHEELVRALWPNRSQARTADSIARQLERIAKLHGLDAPQKIDAKVETAEGPGLMTEQERVQRLEELLNAAKARKLAAEHAAAASAPPAEGEGQEPG